MTHCGGFPCDLLNCEFDDSKISSFHTRPSQNSLFIFYSPLSSVCTRSIVSLHTLYRQFAHATLEIIYLKQNVKTRFFPLTLLYNTGFNKTQGNSCEFVDNS